MPSTMRDSSLDQRTYWLRDGLYYARNGLGEAATHLPPDKLAQVPADDRKILVEETDADPKFCAVVAKIMNTDPDWVHTLSNSAKAAAANEINKSQGRPGGWPKLRARVRALISEVANQAAQAAARLTPAERFAEVKRIAAGGLQASPAPMAGLGDLGQWDVIGSLVGSLVSAGAGVYGSKVTADAQQDIAKLQASSAMTTAQAQMAIANANAAIAGAQAQISNPLSTLTSTTVAGVPVIVPILGLVVAGLWLAFGRK